MDYRTLFVDFNSVSVVLRLVFATFFGGLIGLERGTKRRPAGLRTFALVCLGSALAMVTNQFLYEEYGSIVDPARLAAQVISGIGFLGVGTIIVTGKNYVHGLTTAASLWATATLGIAIGAGFLLGGVAAFVLIMVIIRLLAYVSRHQEAYNRMLAIYVEIDRENGIRELLDFMHEKEFTILSIEKQKKNPLAGKDMVILMELDLKGRFEHQALIHEISQKKSIHYIEEIR